jgi:hypothetical protein
LALSSEKQPTPALFGLLPEVENTTDASGTVKKTDENTVNEEESSVYASKLANLEPSVTPEKRLKIRRCG